MPRDGSGNFTAPAGTAAGPSGTTISSANFNTLVADLVADANLARPIVAGGTGATNAAAALANLGGQPLDADLTALAGLATSGLIARTGAGTVAARTITPSGANITITNGDGVAGNPTIALTAGPLTQIGGLTPVQGDLLYRNATVMTRLPKGTAGQALRMNAGATEPEWSDLPPDITYGSALSASGLAQVELTGIPSTARRVVIMFSGVSFNSADSLIVQLRTSGGAVSSGYVASSATIDGSAVATTTSTAGMIVYMGGPPDSLNGHMTLIRNFPGGNEWTQSHQCSRGSQVAMGGGRVIIAGALTGLRFAGSGSGTFDAGTFNVMWE